MAKQEKQPQHYYLRMAMADRRALVAMLESRDDDAPPDDSRAWLEPSASLRYVLPRRWYDDPALRARLRRLEPRVGGRVRFVRFPCQRA